MNTTTTAIRDHDAHVHTRTRARAPSPPPHVCTHTCYQRQKDIDAAVFLAPPLK
jgi:hypothetical protein